MYLVRDAVGCITEGACGQSHTMMRRTASLGDGVDSGLSATKPDDER
jgi:hypothetical protein